MDVVIKISPQLHQTSGGRCLRRIYPDRGILSTCFRDPDGNLMELEEMMDGMVA